MLGLFLSLLVMFFQASPHAKQLIDTDMFTVWHVTWPERERTPVVPHPADSVTIYLSDGTMKLVAPDNTARSISFKTGQAFFEPKGRMYGEENTSEKNAVRAIIINLKEHRDPPLQNTSGYPNAFPRPGVKNILENDRVVVWDYTWSPGVPTPVHFHDKYVVVVYLENGAVKSTTLDGNSVVNEISFGLTTANPRARLHTEEVVKGKARAVIMELK
jgi:hypothetical protein